MTAALGSAFVSYGLWGLDQLWPDLIGSRLSEFNFALWVLAAINVIYGVGLYWFVRKKNSTIASLISFVLFVANIGILMSLNSFQSAPVIGISVFVIVLSGIYASWLPVVLYSPFLVEFALQLIDKSPWQTHPDYFTVITGGLASLLGFALWHTQRDNIEAGLQKEGILRLNLQNERIRSDLILTAIEDGVIYVDEHGVINMMNPAASAITGWPVAEAKGLDHRGVMVFMDDKSNHYTETQNPFTKAITQTTTIRDNAAFLQTRDNKIIPVSVSASPLLSADGVIQGVVAVFRDVSKERSEEKQRAEFISTASHEMRTPVAAIEGYLALALNDKVCKIDAKAHDFLEKAHDSTQHLGQLFQDLLTSAKAEDGRLSNHPSVVEMGDFISRVAEDMRFAAQKKHLLVEYAIGTGNYARDSAMQKIISPLYYVHVDPDRIREVITNLFDNAVKYTEQGKISLAVTGDDQNVQIHIRDTGAGIPADDIGHLFEKFYRVDNSATRTIGGTGLGLFICRKIVELYSGRIWVESTLGQGTTFYINLPRISTEIATRMQAQEAANVPAI